MNKRIFCALLAALMIVLMLPVQAFAATEEIKGAYVGQKFEHVIGNVVGAKTFSKSGDIPEGLKVSGAWAYKNTYGDYVLKITLEGRPSKAGTYNFSINYKSEAGALVSKIDYTITVGEKAPFDYVESINIDKWPTKTEYYLGDSVDLTGMKVSAIVYTYNAADNLYYPSEIDVTDLVWVEPSVFTSDEAQNVDVLLRAPYNQDGDLREFKDHFRVSFKYANPNDIIRIEVYKKPSKLTYTEGETLDTTDMTLRLHKGDGSAEDVTTGFTTDVTKLDEVGTKTVTVSYGEGEKKLTATFDVTVTEKVEEPVSSAPEAPSTNTSSQPEAPSTSTSSVPESSEPEVPSESEVEVPSESEPEVPSESEVEVPSEPESSEPEEIEVIGGPVEPEEEKGGVPVWAWIIIVLLVILIAATVALFLIGRKRIDD